MILLYNPKESPEYENLKKNFSNLATDQRFLGQSNISFLMIKESEFAIPNSKIEQHPKIPIQFRCFRTNCFDIPKNRKNLAKNSFQKKKGKAYLFGKFEHHFS